jgi:hypothetical protein
MNLVLRSELDRLYRSVVVLIVILASVHRRRVIPAGPASLMISPALFSIGTSMPLVDRWRVFTEIDDVDPAIGTIFVVHVDDAERRRNGGGDASLF